MPCFYPMQMFTSRDVGSGSAYYGKTFSKAKALNPDHPEQVPCGYCIGCRYSLANQWGVRAHHEAKVNEFVRGSAFLTLTFNDKHLPKDNSIRRSCMQQFMRRLRKLLPKGVRIRFIVCGEYGDKNQRAHYHALIFGWSFPDKMPMGMSGDSQLFESELLNKAWPFGFARIGEVNYSTGRYVASYTMKKVRAKKGGEPFYRVHPDTGQVFEVEREFALMSRGGAKQGHGGIGIPWLKLYKDDVYPSGFCVINGRRFAVPQAYVLTFSEEEQAVIKKMRRDYAKLNPEDSSPERLRTREKCLALKLLRSERMV